jgi:taurine dioxygenase
MNDQTYRRIRVEPLAGSLGAEVSGVDLANFDDETFAEVRRAFTENLVLCFHDQDLTPNDQCTFIKRLGPLTRHPMVKTLDDHPFVAPVIRDADAHGVNFGGVWHIDASFIESPPFCTALYAIEVPTYGGDTLFSNLYLAYESLSPGMRELCDRFVLIHSASVAYDADGPKKSMLDQKGMQFTMREDPTKEMEHPLVCTHEHSGRKLLWLPGGYAIRIKGMSEEESKPILDYLHSIPKRPELTCRVRYRAGSLCIWDNRCTQHLAVNDYAGTRRVMHRVQVGGPLPVGPAMPVRISSETGEAIHE